VGLEEREVLSLVGLEERVVLSLVNLEDREVLSLVGLDVAPRNRDTKSGSVGQRGVESKHDIRTIQELLEYRDVSTTMIDTHVLNRGGLAIRSSFDLPPAPRR
jgi:site-specific recombinase XerC